MVVLKMRDGTFSEFVDFEVFEKFCENVEYFWCNDGNVYDLKLHCRIGIFTII